MNNKLLFGLMLLLIIGIEINQITSVAAQSNSTLASEINGLRTRVTQLETETRSLRQLIAQQNGQNYVPPPGNNTQIGASDPMFERLATLVIELKERVVELEKRLEEIEKN
ncbi:MAG: hypothetical protein DSM107014_03215 [Gomphosphaeria aponina SAG 52.96 = DSM 107014]|uniref:Uncharacterized protein n=1 Tax=Gomphosphaeria aponina SAG 52.96 = DSM 107014 TaxID=1521640 RepID=A0A941GTX9_9CHRO|nr:hypothetical protein [Gomphosphaeria aponina SAG 52.96 = DSM 107014]